MNYLTDSVPLTTTLFIEKLFLLAFESNYIGFSTVNIIVKTIHVYTLLYFKIYYSATNVTGAIKTWIGICLKARISHLFQI